MRFLLFGDVSGWIRYHAGDEAMLTANLEWIRGVFPGAEVVLVSEDPEFTSRLHKAPCVPELAPRRSWLGSREDKPFLEALKDANVLFLSGGGNLNSHFPDEIRRRARAARAARRLGVPVVLTGQTVGPRIACRDRACLSEWLPHASYVGLRDSDVSPRIVSELGVRSDRVSIAPDDAFLLEPALPRSRSSARLLAECGSRPLVGVSLHRLFFSRLREDEFVARLATCLTPLLVRSDAGIVFLPHQRTPGRGSDIRLARILRRVLPESDRVRIVKARILDRELLALTGCCKLVVSTRYHGVVFALAQGVPVVGVADGEYSRAKLVGAFRGCSVPDRVIDLVDPALPSEVARAWRDREDRQQEVCQAADRARDRLKAAREQLRRVLTPLVR